MNNKVITISREFGSGGRTIGRKAAEKLGIPCYDAELIDKIAQESGYSSDYIRTREDGDAGGWLSNALADRSLGPTNQDRIWELQNEIILKLAEEGPCVIVGRCADFILRDRTDCLNVFIHADPEKRAERIVKEYGEREISPEKRIKEKDKRRAAYHHFYTDMKWGHAQNYHICLDSGKLGIDKCVELITELF